MRELLWEPSAEQVRLSNMTRFREFVNSKYGLNLKSYENLYDWSVTESPDFWTAMWEFGGVKTSSPYHDVVVDFQDMLKSRWFAGARLNFAENLLRFRDEHMALVFRGEGTKVERLSYAGLYDQVARLAQALKEKGVTTGSRVVGFMPNLIETVVAMLAATSLGAVWSSCSPDFGIKGALDRLGQIKPQVLFTADGYYYGGKVHDSLKRVTGIVEKMPSLELVVVVAHTSAEPEITGIPNAVHYRDLLARDDGLEIEFTQLPFDHPAYILYSSGTTGVPKCIVHGAGGTLIQHLKEHLLHTGLQRDDVIFYYTTCGWMMWNWLVSALAVGATVVLFDGSPFYPDAGSLWQMAEDEQISVFGTSAKYLAATEKSGFKPGSFFGLSSLKVVLSTGSPLSEDGFRFVYQDIKKDLRLSSISGGTDIISCFALGNPTLPVYAGEIQCRGLGMKVESYNSEGNPVINAKGELVCTASFPSMPIYFLNDPEKANYRKAYFNIYPNVWRHGDYVEIVETGGVIIYGRSDTTLNPGGVRIGTAEIYRQAESMPEIADSIVVGQKWEDDVRVILFVRLAQGLELTEELKQAIRMSIRENTTARHVPAKIIAVRDIPYTLSGKKVELAVHNVIHKKPVLNKDALVNPEALGLFENIDELNY